MAADPLAEVKDKVVYCCGGEHAIGRGIFHLPEQDPLAPPKYVSVRSQQVLSSIVVTLVFLLNLLVIRLAIFTNDVCDGAGRIFIALMLLSLLTSAVMYVQPAPRSARQSVPDVANGCDNLLDYCTCSAKVGYQLGYVLAAAEYLPTEFNVAGA